MATIEEQFVDQSLRFAEEFNTIRANEMGKRNGLLTTNKSTLVAAINEVFLMAQNGGGGGGVQIDDTVVVLNKTWSSQMISNSIDSRLATALTAFLNDSVTSTSTTWSSSRVQAAINASVAGVTKASLDLDNVDNTSDINKPVSTAQQAAINAGVASVTKASLGLSNVNNTADTNKPVSTAQAAADAAVLSQANAYTDASVVGLWDDRGNYDASTNLFPSTGGSGPSGAILKSDVWTISVGGTLGGKPVAALQTVRAMVDAPGQVALNWAISVSGMSLVEDSITEGVTGKAPSQDAVYKALALKQDKLSVGSAAQVRLGNNALATANKALVGLGSVDNTADIDKPVSTAQAAAITTAVGGVTKTAVSASGTQLVADVAKFDFTGAGVNVTYAGGIVTVNVPGASGGAVINDSAIETTTVWSSSKTNTAINTAVTAGTLNMVTTGGAQTLTGKTLTTPRINGFTEGGTVAPNGAALSVTLADTKAEITTTGNLTITFTQPPAAGKSGTILVKNGGAHTHSFALAGGGSIRWVGGTQPTSTAVSGKWDSYVWYCDEGATAYVLQDGGRNI